MSGIGGEGKGRLSVVITLLVKVGHEDEFLRPLGPVLDAMRHEPSFINAAPQRDPEDPTRFMTFLAGQAIDWLQAPWRGQPPRAGTGAIVKWSVVEPGAVHASPGH